ncbi:unnamed protein product [Linum trigynum]|uniref:Phytocyanin domain-containing protein n=1 Tax=Linum trigynum TaxID=586398 RepID=A0AAV2EKC8_9ROSI
MASSSHSTSLFFFFACTVAASFCFHSSMARSFDVGGKEGWVVKPSESYDHWAQRLRFLVNDTLVFKYKKGSDSVAQVTKGDYDSCDASKKLKVMKSGTSIFKLTQSGHFYFISANKQQCLAGQKLNVLVLAVRSPPSSAATPKTPPPPTPIIAPVLPPTASPPPPSPAAGTPQLAPQPSADSSPPPPAGAPAASGNSPAGQPAVSPDTANQTAAKSSSSSSSAAVASLALVAVGLGFISLFM